MEYELVNVEVDQESNSVCFTYTITESSAAKGVSVSPVLMCFHVGWRVTQWVNGKEIPKQVFSTRFHGGGYIPDIAMA
jgi:hypothetical protein|tara:strand:- start:318 stop:551 length:234 start_codon:yes stop_codon:yes gene_type:complete